MSAAESSWRSLGEMLVERRLLSDEQLEFALLEQQRTDRRLGEVLVAFGFVSEQALAEVLLEQVGLMSTAAEQPVRDGRAEESVVENWELPAAEADQPEPAPAEAWEPEQAAAAGEPAAPALRRAGHLVEAEPEPEVLPVVKRVEEMPPRRSLADLQSLEAQVAEFERRSEAIQHSIAEIRGVLAELKAS